MRDDVRQALAIGVLDIEDRTITSRPRRAPEAARIEICFYRFEIPST